MRDDRLLLLGRTGFIVENYLGLTTKTTDPGREVLESDRVRKAL